MRGRIDDELLVEIHQGPSPFVLGLRSGTFR